MKINKSAIAMLLAATLCFTSVAPALAAETSGEDSVVTAVNEELDNEGLTEGEEKDNSDSGDPENSENEQSLENSGDNTLDNSNGVSDAANETSTEELSENEAVEENTDGVSEEIGETAAEANTAEEMAAVEEPSEIDISDDAKAAATFAGGSGTQSDPYKVSNAAQLDAVRYYPEKYFIQTADINLSGVNWTPILDEEPNSWGGYNGNGYSISNLAITNCTTMYIGVFGFAGYIENVTVKNIRIEVTKNNANEELNIGLIAGCAQLNNCSAQGSITVNSKDNSQCSIGGLVGSSPSVEGSHSDVSINVTHNGSGICKIGGIAGTSLYGVVKKSYNKGNITSSGSGRVRIGGILGEAFLYTSISKCVNYGTVESKGTNSNNTIAGIIAWMSSNGDPYVEYSVNFGNIKDTENGVAYAAGIGRNGQTEEFSINNCFNLGNINGNSYSGRIYPSETNSSNSNSNYSYGQSLVNNEIPNGGLLPSGFNGMNMSAEDIRTEISDILDECGCEWVDPNETDHNYFVIGRDTNRFSHSNIGVAAVGDGRIGTAYPTSLYYYSRLLDGLKYTEQVSLLDVMNDDDGWQGSCEGLSISLGMAYLKNIDISKFASINGSVAKCYSELQYPSNNLELRDLINYYQLLQSAEKNNNPVKKIINLGEGIKLLDGKWTLYSGRKQFWQSFIKDVKEADSEKTPLLFSMGYSHSSGHSILTCGYKEDDQYYIIQFYDCNIIDNYLYLFIDKTTYDFWFSTTENAITQWPHYASNDNWHNFEYFSISNWDRIDSEIEHSKKVNSTPDMLLGSNLSDQYVQFTITAGTPFRIKNSSEQYLEYSNNKLSGTLDIFGFEIIGDNSKYRFKIAYDEDYSITNFADSIEFSFLTENNYISANIEGSNSVHVYNGNALILNGNSISYNVRMSMNIETGLVELVGDASNSIVFEHDSENIIIESEYPSDVEVNAYDMQGSVLSSIVSGDDTIIIDEQNIDSAEIASGSCGENLTYTVTGTGDNLTLTISGEGDMYDYAYFNPNVQTAYSTGDLPPWVSDANIRKNIKRIIVKEGVTGIGSGAFSYVGAPQFGTKARINGIKLPRSLRRIGRCAFYNTGCDTVTIGSPNNPVKMESVDPRTGQLLKGNGLVRSNFRKVNICLGDSSGMDFEYSSVEDVTFIEGTQTIPASCFVYCDALQNVEIPKSVISIDGRAFWTCHNLSRVGIPDEGDLESIAYEAFMDCNNLSSITLSSSLSLIDQNAFENCTSLESIDIPDSVSNINSNAFKGCTSLRRVNLSSGITKIPYGLFSGCESIESITIPESVTEIDSRAFQNCKKLTSIVIPTSVGIDSNNTTYKSYDGCLYNSDLTELLYCPEGKESIMFAPQTTTVTASAFRCGENGGDKSKLKELNFKTCAPDISENAFGISSITATAYYNNYLNTWSPEKCQNYGGQITWAEKALDLSDCNMTISPTSYSYNGTAKKPAVSLNYGEKKLALNTDYTIVYKNNTNAGKATVTATGNGYFTGTVAKTFTIKKIANTITAKSFTRTYSTKAQVFSLGVKIKKGTPTYKSSSKSVTVSKAGKVTVKAKFIGKATIKITAPESTNYSAITKKITIMVNPTKTALSSVTSPSAGKMTVKWKKNAVGTGYQIQYSTSSKFTSPKSVTITKNSTLTRTIGSLAKGKKYYVRIRTYKTVGSTKFYSGWSAVKAVTVRK